jgi:hypothetical protein
MSDTATPEPSTAPAPAGPAGKPPYPPPAAVPTQEGPLGIRFDFNSGCRVVLPEPSPGACG